MDQSILTPLVQARPGLTWRRQARDTEVLVATSPRTRVMWLRMGLIIGSGVAIGIAAWAGDPSGYLEADPALARLLRGMAVIKAIITLGIASAVYWRMAWPVSAPVAGVYIVSSWALAGATALIWQLSYIGWAALLFHVAAVTMLVVGWRES